MHPTKTAMTAYRLLNTPSIAERLGLSAADAARLGLALPADADAAPALANRLLAEHAEAVADLERQERHVAATEEFDADGRIVIAFEISEPTRRCLDLVEALRIIAESSDASGRAA